MSGLTAADFASFVAEVHNGRRPFPWQSALVESVLGTGAWPEELDIPTGLGKTSVLDVAVFTAAANREAALRRMFFVVDRKLIVDQAHDHATTITTALAMPDKHGPVCGKVAQALRLIDDDAPAPLSVTRMRGGITWDRMWVDRPDRYAIVTGTVDQIGSRALFRGYGLTERARPIDAALVGCDSLIIIDEAHLSSAFATTLRAAIDIEPARLRTTPIVVSMSATTTPGTGNVHGITDADRANPIAAARLAAAKTMHLVSVPTNKDSAAADMATAMAELAASQAAAARVTLVVANTVDRARRTFDILKTNKGADVVLWT
ncbi:MAG: DEAD/DEAH box helicase family protein, partial [Stackebrandtia sp.]